MMRVPALVLAATVLAAALPSMPGSARSDPVPGEITLERELALSGGSRAPETRAAAVADFNEDGLLDIASLGGSATSSILLLLGDNEHEFARSLPVASDAPSDRIVAGDFDEDGHNDLMHGVLLLRGRGDGSFADPEAVSSESIEWPSEELASDLDGDGHLDLAITYEPVINTGSRLVVLWGHGDGTFEAPSQVTYLSRGFKIHLAADLTEDGMLDLVGGSSVYLGPGVRSDSLVVFPSLGSRAFGTRDSDRHRGLHARPLGRRSRPRWTPRHRGVRQSACGRWNRRLRSGTEHVAGARGGRGHARSRP